MEELDGNQRSVLPQFRSVLPQGAARSWETALGN
jgi:hypothetical protein